MSIDEVARSWNLPGFPFPAERAAGAAGPDEKIITAWNGMAVSALAKAGSALQAPMYIEKAKAVASFGLIRLQRPDGRLCRSFMGVPVLYQDFWKITVTLSRG